MKHLEKEMKVKLTNSMAAINLVRSSPHLDTKLPYVISNFSTLANQDIAFIRHLDGKLFQGVFNAMAVSIEFLREWTSSDELEYLRTLESELLTTLDQIQKQIVAIESAS